MNLRVDQNSAMPDAEPVPVAAPLAACGSAGAAEPGAAPEKRTNLRPLASLLPYVKRYRGRALAALGALDPGGADDADGAGRRAAHDRFRLHGPRHCN